MNSTEKALGNLIFATQLLLIFLLLFSTRVQIPAGLQVAGRFHPLLLHLPIGFLLLLALLPLIRREMPAPAYGRVQTFLLYLSAAGTSLSALSGFLLSREEGYNPEWLAWHQRSGVALSFSCWLMLLVFQHAPKLKTGYQALLALNVVLLALAGHLGAGLTHGENYLWEPLQTKPEGNPNSSAFAAAIAPVLEKRCVQCHNEKKSKGKLMLHQPEALLKGGKNGALWTPGDAANSLLVQRLLLPLEHEEHMPPTGKAQPSPEEIALIEAWINAGADMERPLSEYAPEEPFRRMAEATIGLASPKAVYAFKPAATDNIQALNTPYCSVTPLALHSPALEARLFGRDQYQTAWLENLLTVKNQLVSLNLSNLPVQDTDLDIIARFPELERLLLNGTSISSKGLEKLKACQKLHSLGLAQTQVGKELDALLDSWPQLREIYLWNTAISGEELEKWRKKRPALAILDGYQPDPLEVLQVGTPMLENKSRLLEAGQTIAMKHPLPGVEIRYTTDASEPDSLNAAVYEKPLAIQEYTLLRARAFRKGWKSSAGIDFPFFFRRFTAAAAEIQHQPDAKYRGSGAPGLIDGQKGEAANYGAPFWMGFREAPLVAFVEFQQPAPPVKRVTLSYGHNIGSYLFPPQKVEIWGGPDRSRLQLLAEARPSQPSGYEPALTKGIDLALKEARFTCYKIVARPVEKLPSWHGGKGQKGWFFIDEILFY